MNKENFSESHIRTLCSKNKRDPEDASEYVCDYRGIGNEGQEGRDERKGDKEV